MAATSSHGDAPMKNRRGDGGRQGHAQAPQWLQGQELQGVGGKKSYDFPKNEAFGNACGKSYSNRYPSGKNMEKTMRSKSGTSFGNFRGHCGGCRGAGGHDLCAKANEDGRKGQMACRDGRHQQVWS